MEIAEAASFGTRKSQVQILPPRPPSNKIGGTEYYRYEFWVGSWVADPPALSGAAGKPRRTQARNGFRGSSTRLADTQARFSVPHAQRGNSSLTYIIGAVQEADTLEIDTRPATAAEKQIRAGSHQNLKRDTARSCPV